MFESSAVIETLGDWVRVDEKVCMSGSSLVPPHEIRSGLKYEGNSALLPIVKASGIL